MKVLSYFACLLIGFCFLTNGFSQAPKPVTPTLKNVAYAEDHKAQVLDVYQAESETSLPAMVYIHGGGWRGGSKDRIPHFLAQAHREGWLNVVSVEYRFTDVAPHPTQVNDCTRAIQFVRSQAKQWNIDPDRIGVTGGSAGAHLSLWVALHDDVAKAESEDPVARKSSRVSFAIGFAGPTDWSLLGEIPHQHPAYRQLLGYEPGTPAEEMDPGKKKSVSPISYASPDDPPVLILHGDEDRIVPLQHAIKLERFLKEKGGSAELLVVKGGKHNVAGGVGAGVVERATAFMKTHLSRN